MESENQNENIQNVLDAQRLAVGQPNYPLEAELRHFTGTENHYKHWTGRIVFTDGVHYLAAKARAFWLINAVVSYDRKEPFQIWMLDKHDGNKATLTMKEDTEQPILVKQEIPYTDFPLAAIKLYLIGGVLLLPSEY